MAENGEKQRNSGQIRARPAGRPLLSYEWRPVVLNQQRGTMMRAVSLAVVLISALFGAPNAQAQQPAPNTYDLAGARAAGASDGQIAAFLALMHGFDLAGARAAGFGDRQIADFLAPKLGFDLAGARKLGYGDDQIAENLTAHSMLPPAPPPPPASAAAAQASTDAAEIKALQDEYPDWRKIVGAVDITKQQPDPNNPFRKWLATTDAAYQALINSTNSAAVMAHSIRTFQSETKTSAATTLRGDGARQAASVHDIYERTR